MRGLVGFITIILLIALTAKAIHHYNGECCPVENRDSVCIEQIDTTKFLQKDLEY